MRPALLLALLALAVGCDAFGDDGPAWTQPGAVATFDYEPGPDSLRTRGPSHAGPYVVEPASQRLVQMRVEVAPDWEDSDRIVRWAETATPGQSGTRFLGYDLDLPLDNEPVTVDDHGVRVVVSTQCTGNGWFGGSHGTLAWVRVPTRGGTIQEYGDCARSPGLSYEARGPETVTVPAGTFEAIVVERPAHGYPYGILVEYWSWEAGLVRLDLVTEEGVLRGRLVRSAGASSS